MLVLPSAAASPIDVSACSLSLAVSGSLAAEPAASAGGAAGLFSSAIVGDKDRELVAKIAVCTVNFNAWPIAPTRAWR